MCVSLEPPSIPLLSTMPPPLQPKIFLGKTVICGFLLMLPVAILKGLWSNPRTHELARRWEETPAMWIGLALYALLVVALWIVWVAWHPSRAGREGKDGGGNEPQRRGGREENAEVADSPRLRAA